MARDKNSDFTTKLVNTDKESGKQEWEVSYKTDFKQTYKAFQKLLSRLEDTYVDYPEDQGLEKLTDQIKSLKNLFSRWVTQKRKEEEDLKEMSVSGGGTDGATFTPGTGEQYATPKAFGKNKKFPKYGYKLVNKKG